MIAVLKALSEPLLGWLRDDPVRPAIPAVMRVGKNSQIFVLQENDKPSAITCVSFTPYVPHDESDLFSDTNDPRIAVFYTIWSYKKGAGRQLILEGMQQIKYENKRITRFVTLSPKTDMARDFHLRNGAKVFRTNEETVNYEY